MKSLNLTFANPLTAVFMRMLAWELYVAKMQRVTVGDADEKLLSLARQELGLGAFEGGGGRDFIQKLRKGKEPLVTPKHTSLKPVNSAWSEGWRLWYVPAHSSVRRWSLNPVCSELPCTNLHEHLVVSLRNPALPRLQVFVGKGNPKKATFEHRRGLYFLRLSDGIYLGKSDEFHTRGGQHLSRKVPLWWVFVAAESDQIFTLDALAAAESIVISFWNEVALVKNRNRGSDQKPAPIWLQQGVLFAEAASAAFLWLIRERKDVSERLHLQSWNIPMKKCHLRSEGMGSWPDCYLNPIQ